MELLSYAPIEPMKRKRAKIVRVKRISFFIVLISFRGLFLFEHLATSPFLEHRRLGVYVKPQPSFSVGNEFSSSKK
jgi:hypothetical protein